MGQTCDLCAFWDGERCTQTWRLMVHITPVGGQVDFSTTPGMVPEELKDRLNLLFARLLDRLLPVIDAMPIWEEIREWQLAHAPVTNECPARQIKEGMRPYLKIVK